MRLSLVAGIFTIVIMDPRAAKAQFPEDPHPLQLSSAAQSKLAALGELRELPSNRWRVHLGDLPRAEAINLDDSAWPEVGNSYVGVPGPMWFRRSVTVPHSLHGYDVAGARITFEFDIWAEGAVPLVVYFNGRRVAMGEALEPVVLFDHARPGETVLIAVKALNSADAKHFAGAHLMIEPIPQRPSPETLRLEAVSAAQLIPALAPEGPARESARSAVEAAMADVDVDALQRQDQERFDSSLKTAQTRIEALKPLMSAVDFHLTGNAHIDAAWVWPASETVDVVHRTFATALQLMSEYPAYTYSQPSAAYYDWMADKYPALDQEIADRVKEGRWEVVGGMWVEPDLNMLDGESIVRQLLIGTRSLQKQYGRAVHVGWNVDSFGYNWQLPQIYKKSGIDYFVTQKMDWNETNRLPLKLFYWQSPDGSRILTYFPHNYTNFIDPERMAQDFNVARRENPGLPSMMHLYGIGDHGGGPTRSMLDEANAWMQSSRVFPRESFGTAEAYFKSMDAKIDKASPPVWNYSALAQGAGTLHDPPDGKISVPVWNDELYLEYTRGVYTSQANQKRNMRISECEVLDAEKWSAIAWSLNAKAPYPVDLLSSAWKKVLFNQFHDIAAGSSIGVVYRDAQRDYDDVALVTGDATAKAQAVIAAHIDTRPKRGQQWLPVIVWNSLAWPRDGIVQVQLQLPEGSSGVEVVDEHGNVMSSALDAQPDDRSSQSLQFLAKSVPPLGFKLYFAGPANEARMPPPSLLHKDTAFSFELENSKLRVSISKHSGCITHLVLKSSGYDFIAAGGCGGQLQSFIDKPEAYDAWNIDPGTLDHPEPLPPPQSVSFVDQSPLAVGVKIDRKWRSSSIDQTITLATDSDHLDVANVVQWHEQHTLLKAAVPLSAAGPMATFEIPYGAIQRPATRNNSWENAKFEVPALRWADLGDGLHGLSLVNDSKYGYDARGNVLRLSLLRSPTSPDPLADQGEQRFAYSLYPHDGDWKQAATMRRGYEFNTPMQAEQTLVHPGDLPQYMSFAALTPTTLILSALKKAEDKNGLVFRFYEWAGKQGTAILLLPPGAQRAMVTNLMEKPEEIPLTIKDGTVAVPYTAYSIVTVEVEYPQQTLLR